jgi:acetyl-CoA carboxylase biotin carboxyl carrier protein
MDIRKVKKLIELLEESGISEIEIHEGEESVRISRQTAYAPAHAMYQVPQQAYAPAAAPVEPAVAAEVVPDGHVVKSPMVGTCYLAATPGSPNFVKPGDKVSQGDVLCIIEAMKIMNQIQADVSGVVTSIMAENGQPVEFEQPMFVIK